MKAIHSINPIPIRNVSVIGLGKLGVPLAASFAFKGYQVIGVDVDTGRINAINEGRAPFFEPNLEELIHSGRDRLQATERLEDAVSSSEATFIVVPTPSTEPGGFSLQYVLAVAERIGYALREKAGYHLVVLTSTVSPGATGNEIKSTLESRSGKRCGVDFGLCYSPEFIALGSAIHDFLNPDFLLIGESNPSAGEMLESFYKNVCDNNPPVARMNFVNAELTKLAVNTFITTKISFANMLARICEQLPGADIDTVTLALGLDSRIGQRYLKGAIGYGGPCFPRDNVALAFLARQFGVTAVLAEATDRANCQEVPRLATLVQSKLPSSGIVGILGLAYKPNTDVIEASQGLLLAQALVEQGVETIVYDPVAMENARKTLHGQVKFATSAAECVQQSDVVVIITPWDEFKHLPLELLDPSAHRVIVDCWRILEPERYRSVAEYIPLGVGSQV